MLLRSKLTIVVVLIYICSIMLLNISTISVGYMLTDSMGNTMPPNSVSIMLDNPSSIEEGDIIVFDLVDKQNKNETANVTHRIVDNTDKGYITKGDGNRYTDQNLGYEKVQKQDVKGKIIYTSNFPLIFY